MSSNQKSRPASEQGQCDGWMPGSAGNAHLDERVHVEEVGGYKVGGVESAGVSVVDPDGGVWLTHSALMDARVKLTICMHGTNACQSDVDT